MKRYYLLFLSCFLFVSSNIIAQTADEPRVTGSLLYGDLPSIFKTLSAQCNVKFSYNAEELYRIGIIEEMPAEQPLSAFLDNLAETYKLKWEKKEDGIYYITLASNNKSEPKITGSFFGDFPSILDQIASKYHIRFSYESEYLKNISVNESPEGVPLSNFLDQLAESYKIRWKKEANGSYKILSQKEVLNAAVLQQNKTYLGGPQKFNVKVSGIVIDDANGESIPFATIRIKGTNIGTVTNIDGHFIMEAPTDTSTIVITNIGYYNNYIFLKPTDTLDNFRIELQQTAAVMDEYTIEVQKEELVKNNEALSTIRIVPAKLKDLPNIGEKDVMRTFQLMPGVSASNESSSGLYVRGGTPDQNLILYDGFTVYHVDHLYGFFSAFNANGVKDVQLFKGAFESKYGGRLSSVVDITGKDGNSKKWNLGGEISLLSFNVYGELPLFKGKVTTLFAFRQSYQGLMYDAIFNKFNPQSTQTQQTSQPTGPGPGGPGGPGGGSFSNSTVVKSYFYDLNGKITYRPTTKDIISWSIYNGTDNLDNGQEITTPDFLASMGISIDLKVVDLTNYGNLGTSLKWSRNWNKKFYSNFLIGYSNYYSKRERSNSGSFSSSGGETTTMSNGMYESNDLHDLNFKSDFVFNASKHHQLEFGAFFSYNDIKYNYSQNDSISILSRHEKAVATGIYIQDKIKLWKGKIELFPGVRLTYFSGAQAFLPEPRFTASLELLPKWKLVGGWGIYSQYTNRVVREDILSGSRDFWILSDGKSVPVSSSMHFVAGTNFETKKLLLSVEAYRKNITGITEYSLRYDGNMQGVTYTENFHNGDGYAQGVEFMAQKKIGWWTGWMSYTLAEAKNKLDVYGDDYYYAAQDVRHEFKMVGIIKWKRFTFSASWVFATGRPYTAPEGGYQVTLLDGTTQDFITVGDKNAYRLPDYHRLDISANYNFMLNGKRDIGYVGISLFNVYNRSNVWYKQYSIVEGSIVETNVTYMPITPNVTVSLKFR